MKIPEFTEEMKELQEHLIAHDMGARLVRNHVFTALDAAALVGGFIYFIQFLFSTIVKCLNRKLYLKQVLTDSYLLQKNESYLCVPPGYLAKHGRKTPKGGGSGNGSLKKPKSPSDQGKRSTSAPGTSRTPNLERIDEEEGEDRSQYESMREGGIGSLSHSNGQRVVDSEDDSEEEQTRRQLEQDVDEEMFDAH